MAQTYQVKGGDTLGAIAKQYNVPVSSITGYKSGNPNLIYPGETLSIGGGAVSPTAPPQMSNTGQVQSYLNTVQNQSFKSSFDRGKNEGYIGGTKYTDYNEYLKAGGMNMDDYNKSINSAPKIQSTQEILGEVKKLLPTGEAPQAPNLVETYTKLREDQGITALEESLRQMQAEEDALVAETRQRTNAELDKPVATNVIAGRISEVERQQRDRIDSIVRAKSQMTDQLKTAYGMIDTIVGLTGKDYEYAKEAYDTKFNQVLQTMNLVRDIRNDQVSEYYKAQEVATANLTVYANLIKEGNLSVSNMTNEQQLMITKLEVQSGLGVGFLSNVHEKVDPKANILSINSYQGQTQVLTRNPDGSISVETFGEVGGGSGSSATSNKFNNAILSSAQKVDQTYVTIGGKLLSETVNELGEKVSYKSAGDKRLSEQEYQKALDDAWASVGTANGYKGSYTDFKETFTSTLLEAGYKAWAPSK